MTIGLVKSDFLTLKTFFKGKMMTYNDDANFRIIKLEPNKHFIIRQVMYHNVLSIQKAVDLENEQLMKNIVHLSNLN